MPEKVIKCAETLGDAVGKMFEFRSLNVDKW
jgi:hypothetical protein